MSMSLSFSCCDQISFIHLAYTGLLDGRWIARRLLFQGRGDGDDNGEGEVNVRRGWWWHRGSVVKQVSINLV